MIETLDIPRTTTHNPAGYDTSGNYRQVTPCGVGVFGDQMSGYYNCMNQKDCITFMNILKSVPHEPFKIDNPFINNRRNLWLT